MAIVIILIIWNHDYFIMKNNKYFFSVKVKIIINHNLQIVYFIKMKSAKPPAKFKKNNDENYYFNYYKILIIP